MQPGTKLGPYEILGAIGHGGMGDVYRARDPRLKRQLAIKTVRPGALSDSQSRERFEREARAVAALSHPNILAIYDVGDHEGLPYLAVELLEGDTLRTRLGTSPLPLSTVLDYAAQIGRGLAAAHERGIVHRDLKPENIFVTRDGQIKLLDFGLATEPVQKSGEDSTHLQISRGLLLGTAGYMSPEQARGEAADPRSDIFSFGCVLFEMLSGRRAFKGDSGIDTIHAILNVHPPDVASLRSDVPGALDRVVRRCLEKLPANRFQTARDLVFALETLSDGSGTRSVAASALPSRRGVSWTAAAVLAAVVIAIAGAFWWTTLRDRPAQQAADKGPAPEVGPRLIAVLPFENLSHGGEGYFAAGMTDEVTGQLSKLNGLRVVARATIARFKDPRQQLAAMSKELGISGVVTGTVREDGTRVRVNVELIDAQSGQLIWSEQYDRQGVDIFAAQSDIALRVGEALHASVSLDERARVGKAPTASVAAYELFMRSQNLKARTQEERLTRRIELLRQAVAIDPKFAQAYSEIANLYYFLGAYGDLSALPQGLEAARRALTLDPQLPSAHHGLAMNLQQSGRLQEALAAHKKAVELNPSGVDFHSDYSFGLVTAGRYDEALKYAKHASELSRRIGNYHVGVPLILLDDDKQTEKFLTRATEQFPDQHRLQVLLGLFDLRRGQSQAAAERIRAAAAKWPDNIEVLLARAEILTFAGTPDAPAVVRTLAARAADGLSHNAPYPVKLLHAYHLQRAGATAEAAKIFDALVAANRTSLVAGADWPMVFMQNAAIHALRGETAAALDDLDKAYAAGWRDGRTLAIDPLFASVRSEPRFRQVLSRIEADVAAMRARADYSGLSL